MTAADVTLVVGATGLAGMEVIRLLREAGKSVRALVRSDGDARKRETLEARGAELVFGDLKVPESIAAACRGVSSIISTATSTASFREGDSVHTVDRAGQLGLIESARNAGVEHFVFVSFPPSVDCELQRAKREVEARLQSSGLSFAVLQPVSFSEVWLSPAIGFDPLNGRAQILGTGENAVSWVSVKDVARFTVAALERSSWAGKIVQLGGPDPLSPLQVVRIFEELGAPKMQLEFIPEAVLESKLAAATNPLEEAYAAMMLTTAQGQVVNLDAALELLPGRLSTVREYATRVLKRSQ